MNQRGGCPLDQRRGSHNRRNRSAASAITSSRLAKANRSMWCQGSRSSVNTQTGTAATPMRSKLRMVRAMLNAPPQPVSMSTSSGMPAASIIKVAEEKPSKLDLFNQALEEAKNGPTAEAITEKRKKAKEEAEAKEAAEAAAAAEAEAAEAEGESADAEASEEN